MNGTEWTLREISLMQKNYHKIGPTRMQRTYMMYRTVESIRSMASILGLVFRPRWNDDEQKVLSKNYAFMGPKALSYTGLLPRRSRGAIGYKANNLGFYVEHRHPRGYEKVKLTNEQIEVIRNNMHLSIRQLVNKTKAPPALVGKAWADIFGDRL